GRHSPRLALDHFPAVLCGRRDLLWVRDVTEHHYSGPEGLPPRAPDHGTLSEQHGQYHVGDGDDCCLRLFHRGVHGLVQRRYLRTLHDDEPGLRTVWLGLLDVNGFQCGRTTSTLVGAHPTEHRLPVYRRALHQHRDVDRAFRDRHHKSEPRLHTIGL